MFDDVFQTIYLIEFVLITIVRSIHTSRYRRVPIAEDRKSIPDMILLGLSGVAMLLPLVYIFSSLLDFANYRLPGWTGWLGSVLFAIATWLLWQSHADLGRSWTPTLGTREQHQLVTAGVYRWIRHPMYAAHILWSAAAGLMLANWIAGLSFLLVTVVQYLLRVGDEEAMMVESFGDQYLRYMQGTGRILPRVGLKSRHD